MPLTQTTACSSSRTVAPIWIRNCTTVSSRAFSLVRRRCCPRPSFLAMVAAVRGRSRDEDGRRDRRAVRIRREDTMARRMISSLLLLLAIGPAACSKWALERSGCEWPDERGESIDPRSPAQQQHLRDDAETAEKLA